MKSIALSLRSLFIILLLAAATGCISSYNHSSPKKLGKTIFKILRHQDAAGLKMIIPQESDLESYLATADMPEDELKAFKAEMKLIIGEFLDAATKSYESTSDHASRDGVVLSKAKLGDIRCETWQGPDNELANIEMDISYSGKKYLLKLKDAGKVASGWVVGMEGFELLPVKE